MKLKLIICINTILLSQVFNNLQGQTNKLPLQDSAIFLLQQLNKFSNYKIHFIEKEHPLFPQQDQIDTTKISYYYNPKSKEYEFFLLQYNKFMGVVINDSCHLYFGSVKGYTPYFIRCRPCIDVLREKFYKPLYASEWINNINKDSTIDISLQHKGDTLKLNISGHYFQGNLYQYQVAYYFNIYDGFPVKYIENIEYEGDFQIIEYQVVDYTLTHDPLLKDFLSELMLMTDPALIFKKIISY